MRFMGTILGLSSLALLASCASMTGSNDELTRRVDYLRQDVEDLTKQQKSLAEEIQKLQSAVQAMPAAPSAPAAPAAPPAGGSPVVESAPALEPAPAIEPAPAAEAQNLAADPSALYKKALDLMERGQYTEAQAGFASFIRQFPQSDLADNAQYWIGECFYSQKNYKEAETAFKAVRDHFPFGNKVPDALFKQALCERQLGQEDQAKATLKSLIEDYPDSEAAGKAKGRD